MTIAAVEDGPHGRSAPTRGALPQRARFDATAEARSSQRGVGPSERSSAGELALAILGEFEGRRAE